MDIVERNGLGSKIEQPTTRYNENRDPRFYNFEIKSSRHPMRNRLLLSTLGLCSSIFLAMPSMAHTIMEQVAQTGVLTAGTSKDAFPFAYQDESGEFVGYSVDIMMLIKAELESELKRPLTLDLVALDSDQRISSLAAASVDLVCDASSFTWEREKQVDFSVSYGTTGTRLLVPGESSISNPESLAGKRVGALPKTTNEVAIRKKQPSAAVVLLKDRASGYTALENGDIDAFADDGVLLYAWLQKTNNSRFKVASEPYSTEGIACMLPENNSQFQRIVNLALVRYMQGVLQGNPTDQAIFDRWFGPESDAPLTQDLRDLILETMELVIDFKEELPQK